MRIRRIGRHLLHHRWRERRIFTPKVLARIEQTIKAGEATHAGQVRFVVEGALDGVPLFRNQPPRERALDIFSRLRIWDTKLSPDLQKLILENEMVLHYFITGEASDEVATLGVFGADQPARLLESGLGTGIRPVRGNEGFPRRRPERGLAFRPAGVDP